MLPRFILIFFFFSIFIFFNIQLKILSTSMDTNKNWTKSCTIIIIYYNSHYLSIYIFNNPVSSEWCDLISLQDDLSLYLFTLQGPVDRFREQRYRYWNFENRKIEKFLRYGTKRERKKKQNENEQNALCPCFFGRSACRVPSAF